MVVWAKKHLDAALFLGYFGPALLFVFLIILPLDAAGISLPGWVGLVLLLIWVLSVLWIEIWYLKQKGQNPWNVCWVFLCSVLGLLFLMLMKNKNTQQIQK
jgi:hypothetical protein